MAKKSQRFHMGDIVRVKRKAPWIMCGGKCVAYRTGHGEEARVVGSYRDQFGHGDRDTYTLEFKKHGRVSWYDDDILTLVRKAPSW